MAILDPVQELDQQIAPARRVAEQRPHVGERLRIHRAPLRLRAHRTRAAKLRDVDYRLLRHAESCSLGS